MLEKLKNIRERRGLSLAKAGQAVGCSAQAFHRYELGQGIPRPARMARIIAWAGGELTESDFYETPPAEAAAPRGARSPKAAGGRGAPKAPPATPKRRRAEARAS